MIASNERSVGQGAAATEGRIASSAARPTVKLRDKSPRWVACRPAGTLFSPAALLAWVLAFLGLGACIAPWLAHGWLWLELIGATVALLVGYDAVVLWLARKEFALVLLPPEKGLRGREGQTIGLPLALVGSGRIRQRREVSVAIMHATRESETAIRVTGGPQRLNLQRPGASDTSASAGGESTLLWSWTPEIALVRRGMWAGPRIGIERRSRLGIWRLRQWFDLAEQLRIDADLRPGRREIMRSPVYRSLMASRQTPWTGHGREFERLREYQPGDNFAEIAWKSTARRNAPVTRLFQWEQKQEVYFVVDQSRASALAIDPSEDPESDFAAAARAPRRLLDLAVETALVGATVALELGDEFGLVTYADEPKSWLRAGSGQFQFHRFRDRLLNLEPLPTTADYEALFGELRLRLRRRAYLVLLADLAERSISDSLARGVGLVGAAHTVLITSILPVHARPAFAPGEEPRTEQDVYAALAGEKENQRLGALARQLRQLDVRLRYVPPEKFLRTAVEGYLESKREQRL